MNSNFHRQYILRLAIEDEKRRASRLAGVVDEVCCCIIDGESSKIDIILAKQKARELCNELFPEELYLYDMIYESRFRRLEKQFRHVTPE